MGEEPGRVEASEPSPAVEVARLESEIEASREKLGEYVSELDRRRHAVARANPARLGLILAAGALLLAGAILLLRRAR